METHESQVWLFDIVKDSLFCNESAPICEDEEVKCPAAFCTRRVVTHLSNFGTGEANVSLRCIYVFKMKHILDI